VTAPRAGVWNSCAVTSVAVRRKARYWAAILQPAGSTGRLRVRDVRRGGQKSYRSSSGALSALPRRLPTTRGGAAAPVSMFANAVSETAVAEKPPKPPHPKPHPKPSPTPAPGPTPIPSPVPTPGPTPQPPPPPPPGSAPTLTPVDGGPSYYGQFTNPLPDDPGFFPVAVWGSYNLTPTNVQRYKDMGINVFNWVANPSDQAQLTNIRNAGLYAIHVSQEQSQWTKGPESVGYVLNDEEDMSCGPPACDGYSELRTILAGLPRDGRARYNNWGKGVIFWESDANAQRWLNGDANGPFVDFSSVDIYWFTDDDTCVASQGGVLFDLNRSLTTTECRRASNYGKVIEKMRRLDGLDGKRQPIWNVVEVGTPMSNGKTIQPAQIRAAAWQSIIAGARGIEWFQHSFSGPCTTHYSLLDPCYAAQTQVVTDVGAQIKQLAPVLNAPNVTSGWTAGASVKAMVKWSGGHFYVFAGSAENAASVAAFALPCVGDATATVIGEGRSVRVAGGVFSDVFADGNAVHIYRIDGGASCGLPTT
jgi:hypothetical protein